MRTIAAALVAVLLPAAALAQPALGLGPPAGLPVANPELAGILATGDEIPIEGIGGDEVPPIFVRLYAVGAGKACVERRDGCGFRYYLALSDQRDPPRQSVHALGLLGEVTKAELLTNDGGPPARLRLTVANHPSFVFERNPDLPRRQAVYTIRLSVDSLRVTRSGASMGEPDPLRPRRVANPLMVRVLNDAAAADVDGVGDEGEPPLIIPRLYALPGAGSCPPRRPGETCGTRYYLALNVGALAGRPSRLALFDLGTMGEITHARLMTTNGGEPLRLRTTVINFPEWVFAGPNAPQRREAEYDVVLGADALRVTRLR